ncbi:hypothetical protein FA13DRAFT_1708887 [Coprinellus micaceus]|uniref:Uncharacterized protein n=1 Tax=Coprinellus micaceus TaxID=71717 RepID=A0A4Y7TG46_COPMI|nr:hypothetical protein FA13DRAFT_1708887 [Coprinellus micaceus]
MWELDTLHSDSRFNINPFLDSLSRLTSLISLVIWNIALLLLRVAQDLPNLRHLVVMPGVLSPRPVDQLMKPPLQSLESVAKYNPCLAVLQVALDLTTPIPSSVEISNQRLRILLASTETRDFETFTTSQKFQLVQYFDSLFPHADLDDWYGDESKKGFWDFIRESLLFYRKGHRAGSCLYIATNAGTTQHFGGIEKLISVIVPPFLILLVI